MQDNRRIEYGHSLLLSLPCRDKKKKTIALENWAKSAIKYFL